MSEQLEAMQFLMDSHSKLMAEIAGKDAAIAELLGALNEIEGGGGVQGEIATNALAKHDK